MKECPKIIVYDKLARRNRTIVDTVYDDDGVRWYQFEDGIELVSERDTEEAQ